LVSKFLKGGGGELSPCHKVKKIKNKGRVHSLVLPVQLGLEIVLSSMSCPLLLLLLLLAIRVLLLSSFKETVSGDFWHILKRSRHVVFRIIKQRNTLQKKFNDFPVPSRDVTNQTLPGRE
jgi:hypothetical protein